MKLSKRKRNFLLIEVVVAIFLAAMIAVPLLRPSIAMLRIEMEAARKLRLERQLSEVHVAIVEAMHRNQIDWSTIEDNQWHDIAEPHTATYRFFLDRYDSKGDQYYKPTLTIRMKEGKDQELKRSYLHFIERKPSS